MPRARYHLLDVFTDRPFTGNPLAVFVDPPVLSAAQMQAIAGELNLSETVFVHSPGDGTAWPTRIFTPVAELPFAGHPTVGTAVLLAELGLADDHIVLAEPVGDVAVTIEPRAGGHSATLRNAVPPSFAEAPDRNLLARALSIDPAELHSHLAAGIWSCGVPFCVVPLRDAAVLARAHLDTAVWSTHLEHTDAAGLFPMAPLDDDLHRWRARMYAPGLGIAEDPATGSAAAAAAGVLAASRQLRKGAVSVVGSSCALVPAGRASVSDQIGPGATETLDALRSIEVPGGIAATVWQKAAPAAERTFWEHRRELLQRGLVVNVGTERQPRYVTAKGAK